MLLFVLLLFGRFLVCVLHGGEVAGGGGGGGRGIRFEFHTLQTKATKKVAWN